MPDCNRAYGAYGAWVTKGVCRLLTSCVMPKIKFFLSLALSIRFTKYILKTLALFSVPMLFRGKKLKRSS